jgi:signal transduction histidine kinase/CHASE2 domain-containing sensor protein
MDNRIWTHTGLWIGLMCAILLILMQALGLLSQARLSINNIYYNALPTSDNIVLIAIDDTSLNAYGRAPNEWSRTVYADLIAQTEGARIIAFDLIFSETQAGDETFVEAIRAARTSDTRTRFVFAASGARVAFQDSALEAYPNAVQISRTLHPIDPLAEVADYIGYVDTVVDVDGMVRRQPSIIEVNDRAQLGFNLAVYMAYLRLPAAALSTVVTADDNTLYMTPERPIPVDERGFWMQQFFDQAGGAFPIYNLVDVVEGRIPPGAFDDKIVMVGLYNSTGITDRYPVPVATSGTTMSGVEIHANAIETIIANAPLAPFNPIAQWAIIGILAIFSGVLYVAYRWYIKLMMWTLLTAGFTLAAFFIFSVQQQIIDLLYVWLALALPLAAALLLEITTEINRRRQSEFLLNSISQVEKQRLKLDHIWALLADDIQRIAPKATGVLLSNDHKPLQWVNLPDASVQTDFLSQLDKKRQYTFTWQGKQHGHLYLSGDLSRKAEDQLNKLIRQITPALDNATLFKAVNQQNETLEAIFATTPESIIVLDEYLTIERYNQAFDLLLSDAAIGESFVDILTTNDNTRSELRESFAEGLPFKFEIKIQAKTVNIGAATLSDHGWVVVLADVTRLAELNTLKTRMLRMASHDLKNPLARISGFAELISMMEDRIDQKVHNYVNYIKRAGDEMLGIITDILESEQLRTGNLQKEVLNFVQITHEIISRYEPDIDRKRQSFTSDIADDMIVMVGNYRQISQVVSNLLSNAIKYTPDGGHIHVTLHNDNTMAKLEIRDDGYGISEEAQAKLFTEFYRVQTDETAQIEGTGLGLSLAKSVVENHNGRVWVESKEGEGSAFFVELPVYKSINL